jgi:hypothetical protein
MIPRHLLRTLLLTLLAAAPVVAQETPPETDRAGSAQQELRQKALGLLEDVIKDSELFRHAENRLRVRAAAANVLWDHDPERARLLFKEVMTGLADLLNSQEAGDESEHSRMLQGPRQLRRELLQQLALRDPRLARELLRTTRAQEPGGRSRRGDVLADRPLELNLATQLAETDPGQALEIAEETLAGGLSYELPGVLSALQAKDPAAASRLASQIVVRLRAEKLDESDVAKSVAVSLLRLSAQAADDDKAQKSAQPLLDTQTAHELIEKLAAEALRPNTNSPELLDVLNELMPAVEKYAPARAAQVRRKVERREVAVATPQAGAEAPQVIPAAGVDWNNYQSVIEKGGVEEILAAAADAPEGLREALYQRAAAKMAEGGDAAGARRLINERIKNPDQRQAMLAELDGQAAFSAAQQGNLEQARKLIATLRTNEERVLALVQLAEGATAKGDKGLGLALLDEAREMSSARAKNVKQLMAQLAVARAYGPLDASRSLAILEPAVDQLNELLAAGVVLGGFFAEELVQDDEIMMEPLTSVSNEIFNTYIGDLSTLARADFERTRALADRFQRPEIRSIARLLVAHSVLTPKQSQPSRLSGSVIMGRMQ